MGYIQIGVVALALVLRLAAFGWFAIIGVIVSVVSLGLIPAIMFGPLIFAGFAAPPIVWPLLIAADTLLLVCALTSSDGGDNDSTSPLEVLTGRGGGLVAEKVFRYCGIAYLITLPALVVWTLAA
ncbi:hypothetical protein [Nocardia cyriacigeorgica]|uniref:hypothetical protein n=1 Tax=Nocardia cyriacigeorgica TaxID=135487 RepID=UPI0018933673|nr:hypothetical protein [Nocardia cyriacigeorgica]MBF6088450.1 hypothetical protein [Nocardia cyriacigeorgica]MBF6095555.1 hypothetical protein [Nocardia cyriacigeorgica]